MLNLDRYIIDDGRHLPQIVIDEDASTAAGAARYRSGCACGRMLSLPPGTHENALNVYLAHIDAQTGPAKGPEWLPVGVRVALLALVMVIAWGACFVAGQIVAHHQDLTGASAVAVRGGSDLAGLALAFGLMVAARRYIAPTRA
ncbi:hypothetical protein [Streptomyces olivaceus]|uniref:hypothetical protein n=1 Tax=Streptomyces olivaceus TaxID=47716 RepID=UPI0040563F5A